MLLFYSIAYYVLRGTKGHREGRPEAVADLGLVHDHDEGLGHGLCMYAMNM